MDTFENVNFASIIQTASEKCLGAVPSCVTALGGGFYGRVFLVETDREPYKTVYKIYLYGGLAEREAAQLQALSLHALIKMPEVYFHHGADVDIPNDVLAMEYVEGNNIGNMELSLDGDTRQRLANIMIDNQLSYHAAVNAEGFGDIGAASYEPDWVTYYYPKAQSAYNKITELYKKGKITSTVNSAAGRAFDKFDRIFYLPVEKAGLIHGDYNTWNILFDDAITRATAVIDPFDCCWSDPELDLYQLTHANGNYFGLLDLYKVKSGVSENFMLKNSFYELFTEMTHHYNANQDVPPQKVNPYVEALNRQMDYFGL